MDDLDLDIENYNLDDILNLFSLTKNFSKEDLKQSYRVVLKTHPDKSGLDMEYFIFFSKAFKIVKQLYEIKHRMNTEQCVERKDYSPMLRENYNRLEGQDQKEEEQVQQFLSKFENVTDFNKWFNEHFNKVRLYNPETDGGHGDWLQSHEDEEHTPNANSVSQMHQHIQQKKEAQRELALTRHRDYEDMVRNSSETMGNSDYYDPHQIHRENKDYSGVQDQLQYTDVKKAYTESVVPVTHLDYSQRKQYTFDGLRQQRSQNIQQMTPAEIQALQMRKQQKQGSVNTERAYMYAKEMEQIEKSASQWKTYINQITNQ